MGLGRLAILLLPVSHQNGPISSLEWRPLGTVLLLRWLGDYACGCIESRCGSDTDRLISRFRWVFSNELPYNFTFSMFAAR